MKKLNNQELNVVAGGVYTGITSTTATSAAAPATTVPSQAASFVGGLQKVATSALATGIGAWLAFGEMANNVGGQVLGALTSVNNNVGSSLSSLHARVKEKQ